MTVSGQPLPAVTGLGDGWRERGNHHVRGTSKEMSKGLSKARGEYSCPPKPVAKSVRLTHALTHAPKPSATTNPCHSEPLAAAERGESEGGIRCPRHSKRLFNLPTAQRHPLFVPHSSNTHRSLNRKFTSEHTAIATAFASR